MAARFLMQSPTPLLKADTMAPPLLNLAFKTIAPSKMPNPMAYPQARTSLHAADSEDDTLLFDPEIERTLARIGRARRRKRQENMAYNNNEERKTLADYTTPNQSGCVMPEILTEFSTPIGKCTGSYQ
ncbi:hypothetical protein PIB30_102561, partial [Stylosanthes scabra]|nr:hypothetical protein [Stylosanthes scabra]